MLDFLPILERSLLATGLAASILVAAALIVTLCDRHFASEKARAALSRRSEKRFQSLVQNSSDVIMVVSETGIIAYASQSIQRLLGHAAETWVHCNILALVHPQDLAQAQELLAKVSRSPKAGAVVELQIQDGTGVWRILEVIAHNLLDEPTVAGIVLTCHDITQRKQQEQSLRLLQSVVMQAKDPIIITEATPLDLPGPRILYVNQAFTKITGYEAEEALGKTPRILQGEKTDPEALSKIRTALEAWQPVVVELVNYCKDGTEFWAELSIAPVANEVGWFTHWVAIQRNITERKQAEAEIQKALEQERELRELKSRFISMASHEFRTPLATIMASSDLLKSFGHKLSEEKKLERLNKIQAEVNNMTQLLEEVLLIGKAEAGKMQFNPTLLNLPQLCQDILDELGLASDRHSLTFEQVGNEAEPDGLISADEKLLRHILTNLLSNAIKYSPHGGEVSLKLQYEPASITFQIQDQGIGIPLADQGHLFEPFHRASNAGSISGTGLGLAIIRYAATLHGGTIQFDSTVGLGSRFTVSIPRVGSAQSTLT
ncbi:MAG TPA: PAS domain S-box protein [Coleofasciculaceae cyanobacterium]|jgi:PAS domain S-box-containing protein